MSITENIERYRTELEGTSCKLVAISKTKPVELLEEAYAAGQRDFGENKVQELATKAQELPADIRWHMVGHLQRNKVKYIAPFVHLIHSVDSLRLLQAIEKEAEKNNRVIDVLLQVHIAQEETKFGFDEHEIKALLASKEFATLQHVRVKGLMGMATHTSDEHLVAKEFASLKKLLDTLAIEEGPHIDMKELSMGMSNDYPIAVKNGSTLIRIGTDIFGARNYAK